jgi:dCMP deaminase
MAALVASWSKDPSTKTGAVIVDERRRIVSIGFNGFPQGIADLEERLNDREYKYANIIHCERNALIFANRPLTGCTLYTWPFMSCSVCFAMMIQAGIVRHVAPKSDNPRWQEAFRLTRLLCSEAQVRLEEVATEAPCWRGILPSIETK